MSDFFNQIWWICKILIQIGLLATVVYMALRFLRGTRAAIILLGIVMTTTIGWSISYFLNLEVFEWMFSQVPALLAFALIIIFQPELRRAFAEIGSNPSRFFSSGESMVNVIDALIESAYSLGNAKTGALVIIEREIPMKALVETGVAINAPVSRELLVTIFQKETPLHDGAVIIKDGMIIAASCFISNLTQSELRKDLGTRHRAGIGVTEDYDALVIIVSEETGAVSLAYSGFLARDIDRGKLRRHLTNYLIDQKGKLARQGNKTKALERAAQAGKREGEDQEVENNKLEANSDDKASEKKDNSKDKDSSS